jgi:hypothetical protein
MFFNLHEKCHIATNSNDLDLSGHINKLQRGHERLGLGLFSYVPGQTSLIRT